MVWRDNNNINEAFGKRPYLTKFKDSEGGTYYYLVRCMWTKDNVFEPTLLMKCEGRQSHNKPPENQAEADDCFSNNMESL